MKEEEVLKSEVSPTAPRTGYYEIGRPRENSVQGIGLLQDLKEKDLRMPQRLCTFDQMTTDVCVSQPLNFTANIMILAMMKGEFKSTGTRTSDYLAEFLNYNIRNMPYGGWFDFCKNANTDLKYGWSTQNIVLEKRKYGQYAGAWTIKKLAPRSQKSIYGWVFDKDEREFMGMIQKPINSWGNFRAYGDIIPVSDISNITSNNKYTYLPKTNSIHFAFDSKNNNPQGSPPLADGYVDWREKDIISQYEVIGVSKDLGGFLVVRVPQELMERAYGSDPNPKDIQAINSLEEQIKRIHAGKQSSIMLSDLETSKGNWSYDVKLLGIEGGGKQYKTTEIIEARKKNLYNLFGCGFILLGQDSHGSYNLSSTSKTVHSFYIEKNLLEKEEIINRELVTKILAANTPRGTSISYKDMPYFKSANPDELSLEDLGKFIQRSASVQKMTPEMLKWSVEMAGGPIEGIDELDFTSKGDSRSGESQGSSGTGNTQQGGKASAVNSENGSVTKWVLDSSMNTEDTLTIINVETGEHQLVMKEEE